MMTKIKITNTSVTSHSQLVCVRARVVRTLKIYSQKLLSMQYNIIKYSHHVAQ